MNQTKKLFNESAQDYFEKYADLKNYNDTLNQFCDLLSENARVLELACGPGNITKHINTKRPDLQILATDFAEEMLKIGRKECPKAKFEVLDLLELDKLDLKFDGIICGFGLPYISKEEAIQLIKTAKEKLNPNGVLYLSTMEDFNSNSTEENGMKYYFHEKEYLLEAFEENGFSIELCKNQEFKENDYEYVDLILIGKIKLILPQPPCIPVPRRESP